MCFFRALTTTPAATTTVTTTTNATAATATASATATTVATCYHYYCSNRDYGKDVAGYGTEVNAFCCNTIIFDESLSLSHIYICGRFPIYIYI